MCSNYNANAPGAARQPYGVGSFALTIRTATFDEPSEGQPRSEHVRYPRPILPGKLTKALQLYGLYMMAPMEEELAHLDTPGYLSPTGLSTGGTSISSYPTRAESATSSVNGDILDNASVISFDLGESLPSAMNLKPGHTAYNGSKVKLRIRKPFRPRAKAKTALIRWLGACEPCRTRSTPVSSGNPSRMSQLNLKCPLDHHDIAHLDGLWQSKQRRSVSSSAGRSRPANKQSHTSSSSASVKVSTGVAVQKAPYTPGKSELLGIGDNFTLEQDDYTTDVQSPLGGFDPLAGISTQNQQVYSPLDSLLPFDTLTQPQSSDEGYQNSSQFPLGVWRQQQFHCRYPVNDDCQLAFDNAEQLQAHFETAHFPFTRIAPAHRWICANPSCLSVTKERLDLCHCGCAGLAEYWICGNYIRTASYQSYPPSDLGLLSGESPTTRTSSAHVCSIAGIEPSNITLLDTNWATGVDEFDGSAYTDSNMGYEEESSSMWPSKAYDFEY